MRHLEFGDENNNARLQGLSWDKLEFGDESKE